MSSGVSLRALFESLIDADVDTRRARLAALELSEPDSRRLAALLDADATADSVMPGSAESLFERIGANGDLSGQLIGTQLGTFTLIERIGEGGSSIVFKAERPVADTTQFAAIKLMYGGYFSSGAKRRASREQSILAQLSHSNIAHLIEVGSTPFGADYIAMEFVDGLSITKFADQRSLNLNQRLGLILDLCAAIDAAHAALIVHCDLKPSNVLVDGSGVLKVLDFGVARLISLNRKAERTRTLSFTPEYAAPEQFREGPTTVAVDIFAIGVLMGELITGLRLRGDARPHSGRVSVADAPDPPPGLPERAALARAMRGDLDAILAMATAEEPACRYRSVSSLSQDIRQFIDGRPVSARASTRWYRIAKFVGRNRASVATTLVLFGALLASVVIANWHASVARENAYRAQAQAERADAMLSAVFEVISQANPGLPRERDVTIVEAVEDAVDRLLQDDESEPRSRLELLDLFASTLGRQSHVERARELLVMAFAQSERALGEHDEVTLRIGESLTKYHILSGSYADARALLDRLAPRLDGTPVELRASLTMKSATVAWRERNLSRARVEGQRAVSLSRQSKDADFRTSTLSSLGVILLGIGDVDAAIPVFEEVLNFNVARFGPNHEQTALASSALARAYRRSGDLVRAEAFSRRAIAIDRAIYTADHWIIANHLNALGRTLFQARKFEDALVTDLEGLRITRNTLPEGHPDMRLAYANVGATLLGLERYKEAEPYLLEALTRKGRGSESDRWRTAYYRVHYGFAIGMLGDEVSGRRLIEQGIAELQSLENPDPGLLASSAVRRIRLALHAGRAEQALPWLDVLDQAVGDIREPENAWWAGRPQTFRGAVLLATGRLQPALEALREAVASTTMAATVDESLNIEQQLLLARAEAVLGNTSVARERAASARSRLAALPYPSADLVRLERELSGSLGTATDVNDAR